ncbi:MAG: PASTA domain-containing protein [Elusimicrobiaceae bacterium]|nr:PASTA domain-containing protein [Elusimicrobiaceae bacterium]
MTNNTEPNFEEFIGKTRKTSRIKWFAAAVIFVFFALLIFVSIDWVLGALVHTRQEVQVPDITQKPVTTALDSLATVNLALKQAGVEFAEGVPPGSVLRQIPSAGSTVREGRVIRVWISQGDEMVFVPSVEGLDLRAAQLAIRQAGLQVEKVENAFSLTVEKGLIISQKPKADSMLTRGDKVVLTLSNGQPPASVILVPDFRNKKLAEATLWASTQNMNLTVKEDPKSPFPYGTIATQSPSADSQVAPGSALEITVSRREASDDEKTYHLHYELPQGKKQMRIRIVMTDDNGEREVINESKLPGSKIDLEIPYSGKATFRILSDGILVREREIQ